MSSDHDILERRMRGVSLSVCDERTTPPSEQAIESQVVVLVVVALALQVAFCEGRDTITCWQEFLCLVAGTLASLVAFCEGGDTRTR